MKGIRHASFGELVIVAAIVAQLSLIAFGGYCITHFIVKFW